MSKYVLFLLAITLSSFSFLSAQEEIPLDSTQIIEKQTFNFEEFGLSVQLFSHWFIQDSSTLGALMEENKKIMAGDNEKLLNTLNEESDKTVHLLAAFRYSSKVKDKYNPSITIVAEDLSGVETPINTEQYLMLQKQLLQQSQADFRVKDGFSLKRISGQRFYSMHSFIKYGGVYIRQVHYSTIHRGHALSIIISFVKDESQMELEEMVRTIIVR